MTHITRLQADNFKRLTVIDIHPGTSAGVVPIRGRNAQGKSSTLDAIQAALGGKAVMPSRPVRAGEDEGAVRLELSDGAVILRRFTVDGKGDSIEITNAEGFKAPSPQKMLDGLYSSVAFDPLAFTRLDPKDQLKTLRSLVKLDVDVDKLEADNKADYDKRRDVNRDAANAESALARMATFPDAPAQKVDEAALEAKIASAAEHNGEIERRRVGREQFIIATGAFEERLQSIGLEIGDLEARLEAKRDEHADVERHILERKEQVEKAEPLPEPIDVTQAQTDLREARETNRKIDAQAQHVAQAALVEAEKAKSAQLTENMNDRTLAIAAAIERADMPVAGLTFGDGEVLFGGIPLAQASSAEQLRVSTAIGMASSPKLRVMLVRDGSLLDDEGQKILADLAAANEFQLWVEAVDQSGKVGIVLEDGAVSAIDGEAPDAPEEIAKPKRRAKKSDGESEVLVGEGEAEPAAIGDASPDPEQRTHGPDSAVDDEIEPAGDGEPETVVGPASGEGEGEAPAIVEPSPEPAAKPAPTSLFD